MAAYNAPIREINFALQQYADIPRIATLPGFEDATPDTVEAILEEAGRLARDVIGPLNQTGDVQGSVLENGVVRTPDGFAEAWKQYAEGGWTGIPFEPEIGGQGLPMSLAMAAFEIWSAANMSFGMCPMLNQGAIEAIRHHGSDELKAIYLEKMVTGQWVGTMNLTEPNAGSDLGVMRSRAALQSDGSYRIKGSKIFISYGDHEWTENIVHLVLARTEGAPEGSRGISLFIVPKYLVNDDGLLGERNDVRCVSLEEKMGIHASPTCVMAYGDDDNCVGYLVGKENKGLANMFTMMNNERLAVGMQGVAIADRSFQQALDYARDRKQGKSMRADAGAEPSIIEHADVRRMLMTMKAHVEAVRAVAYLTAGCIDVAGHHTDDVEQTAANDLVELLTPIAKSWSTDIGFEVASIGVQVHGGLGFIEETGAAQYMRDARIAPIYEGTNGIQAMDLVMRKLPLKDGSVVRNFIAHMNEIDDVLKNSGNADLDFVRPLLLNAIDTLSEATEWMLNSHAQSPNSCAAGATPYLRMFGMVTGGFLLAKGAVAAIDAASDQDAGDEFHMSRLAVAMFFAEQMLPQAEGLLGAVMAGEDILYTLNSDQLAI
jgi:3-(methylthio)propanoyl-CoA dehydrogenase